MESTEATKVTPNNTKTNPPHGLADNSKVSNSEKKSIQRFKGKNSKQSNAFLQDDQTIALANHQIQVKIIAPKQHQTKAPTSTQVNNYENVVQSIAKLPEHSTIQTGKDQYESISTSSKYSKISKKGNQFSSVHSPIPFELARSWCLQICHFLKTFHGRSEVYGDMHANRILLTEDWIKAELGKPKASKKHNNGQVSQQSNTSLHALEYIGDAGQSCFESKDSSLESDIYSLGNLILEVFSKIALKSELQDVVAVDIDVSSTNSSSSDQRHSASTSLKLPRIVIDTCPDILTLLKSCWTSNPNHRISIDQVIAKLQILRPTRSNRKLDFELIPNLWNPDFKSKPVQESHLALMHLKTVLYETIYIINTKSLRLPRSDRQHLNDLADSLESWETFLDKNKHAQNVQTVATAMNIIYPKKHTHSPNSRLILPEVMRSAWSRSTKPLTDFTESWKQRDLINRLSLIFRVDMFGNVVSKFACKGSATFFHYDHFFPHARGGNSDDSNIIVLSSMANQSKSSALPWTLHREHMQGGINVTQLINAFTCVNGHFGKFPLKSFLGISFDVPDSKNSITTDPREKLGKYGKLVNGVWKRNSNFLRVFNDAGDEDDISQLSFKNALERVVQIQYKCCTNCQVDKDEHSNQSEDDDETSDA
jgi:hypothetical protein